SPKRLCPMRNMTSAARLLASPHKSNHIVKPPTALNMTPRQPSRLASQPVVGVAMAVATRLSVTTQAISSYVARKRASDLWQDDIGQGDRHAKQQARQLHG